MKKKVLFFFCMLCCISVMGQKEITVTGTVTNAKSEPQPYIDVLLKRSDSIQSVVAFAITDKHGRYRIIHQTKQSELILETSSLVHEPSVKVLTIIQNTQGFTEDIVLSERIEELQEVQVTGGPRVLVKNDTTVFNLARLTDGSERVVEEILEKLPGVTIENSGQLKFKGKKVGNVLLDGDNLFNGNYTVGTKNINAAHITGVEAIENFEDNPLLQGLSENDDVALNLKFGDGVSLSGDAELSYASGNRVSVNTTAIGVSKKLKGFSIASYNSIGNNLNNARFNATDFIDKLREQHSNGLSTPSYIGDNSNFFPANNSVSNNEFFGSLNLLPKLSDTETLRLNIDVLSDRSLERRTSLTLIGTDTNDLIRIEETNSNLIKPLYLNSSIFFQKFSSTSKSWTTNLRFSKLRNDRELLGIRNDQEQGENVLFKELFLSNITTYTHRIDKKSALKLEGLVIFSEKPENLALFSGIDFGNYTSVGNTKNNQNAYSSKRRMQMLANFYKKFREKDKFNLKLILNYYNNGLISSTTNIDDSIAFQNSIDYSVFLPEISADYLFKQNKYSLRPIIKAKLYSYTHTDNIDDKSKNNNELLFDASIGFRYEFDKRNSISTGLGHFNSIPKEENLYTNFILRSNRVLQNNELNFDKLTSNNFNIFYRYDNLNKNTNIRLGFSYEKDNNAYLSANTVNSNVFLVTNFLRDNGSENRIWNFSFIKYVSSLRSTIRFTSSHNRSNYFNLFNDSELRFNNRELTNATFGIGTSFIGKFLFGNNLSYNQTYFSTQGLQGFKNQQITNNFNVAYVSSERFRIDADLNYFLPDITNSESYALNMNASMGLQNKKKTINYILEGRNLLNQSNLGSVNNSDFSTTISSESLFERLFIFTVNFKF